MRQTLSILGEYLPGMQVHEVPSGTVCFDWVVPREWRVREAWIKDPTGRKVVDFAENNLHLVGYSVRADVRLPLEELQKHLYSLPEQPDAIPYVTSYYAERWGFCMTQQQRDALPPGNYHIYIDSELFDGSLTYGELYLPGESLQEVFLSTNVCHPSMANNELSGPVVVTALAQWLSSLKSRRYAYRIVFIPETIGSLVYLSKNLEYLKEHIIAGFNVTCIGDDRCYSYLPSRIGRTLADRVALHVMHFTDPDFKRYSWLDRGSDERQYCAPGVNLPVASIMRSKYGTYPEYHTSLDDLSLITPTGLQGGFNALKRAIETIEGNAVWRSTVYGEPQLGKRGLYPTVSTKHSGAEVQKMMDLISYCDGEYDLLSIAEMINVPFWSLSDVVSKLSEHGLLEKV